MAGKAKAEGTSAAAVDRRVISSTFDEATFAKIESLAKSDERSLSQWLARYVRKQLEDVDVPKQEHNVTELKAHA